MRAARRPDRLRLPLAALATIAIVTMGAVRHHSASAGAEGIDGPGDTSAPAGTISIESGTAWTNTADVTVSTPDRKSVV